MTDLYKLELNPDNPRVISDADLKKLKNDILANLDGLSAQKIAYRDNIVVSGNQRYKALRALKGEGKVKEFDPDWFKDVSGWTDEQIRKWIITTNTNRGKWDWDILAKDWDADELADWGLTEQKWSEVEEPELTEDSPPDMENTEVPVSVPGTIYKLGEHRLLCGDSTDIEGIERLMDGHLADMVFTDPPYNVDYGATMKDKLRGGTRQILNDKFDTREEFYQFLYDAISAFRQFVKGGVYIAMSSSELDTLQKAFRDCDGHWSTFIIWVKNTFTMGRADYQRQYEPILYGWFEKSSHFWSGARNLGDVVKEEDAYKDGLGDVYLKAENVPTDIWEFPKPTKSKEHPTMKPIALVGRSIQHSSKKGGRVLDVFGGSGTTLIACEQLGRKCYMVELDPKYADVIRRRYAKFVDPENWEETWQKVTAPAE